MHDPVMVGLIAKVLCHLGGQHHLCRRFDRLVDRDHPVTGQVEDAVAVEQQVLYQVAQERQAGQPGQEDTVRKGLFDQTRSYPPILLEWPGYSRPAPAEPP